MIHIENKEECCGCRACQQICPKNCIDMIEDEQGFAYPRVDISKCIDCNLCVKKCPIINQECEDRPIETYAAKNKDKSVQQSSSSGGVFTLLAQSIIKEGGVVFGAGFKKDWTVVHVKAETAAELSLFKGSKYVQSNTASSYIVTKKILLENRKVLYSGTPCQIAGLKLFLGKEYSNLITIDIICHGVPSPKIWKEYLNYVSQQNKVKITQINFRDKSVGWVDFKLSIKGVVNNTEQNIVDEHHQQNIFMQYFLRNVILRPSCYNCQFRNGKSHSDITLGDFWGIQSIKPELFDNNGISAIIVNTKKGSDIIEQNKNGLQVVNVDYSDILGHNSSLSSSCYRPKIYQKFWEDYNSFGFKALSKNRKSLKPGLLSRIINRLKRFVKF